MNSIRFILCALFVVFLVGCEDSDKKNAVYLLSMDYDGKTEWKQSLDKNGRPGAIKRTKDGGFYIAGRTDKNSFQDLDLYLALYDSAGEKQWSKTSDFDYGDEALCLDITSDGGCILGGRSRLYREDGFIVDTGKCTRMLFAKADSRGEIEWNCAEKINGLNWITSVVMTASDESFVVIADHDLDISTLMYSQIIKYSPDGKKQWSKDGKDLILQSLSSFYEVWTFSRFYQVREKEDDPGYFYFLSIDQGYSLLLKVDADGKMNINEKYSIDDSDPLNAFYFPTKNIYAYDFVFLNTGGVVMVGYDGEFKGFKIVQKNAVNEIEWEDTFRHENGDYGAPQIERVKILTLKKGYVVLICYKESSEDEEDKRHEHLVMYSLDGNKLWTMEDDKLRYADIEVAENGSILLLAKSRGGTEPELLF